MTYPCLVMQAVVDVSWFWLLWKALPEFSLACAHCEILESMAWEEMVMGPETQVMCLWLVLCDSCWCSVILKITVKVPKPMTMEGSCPIVCR